MAETCGECGQVVSRAETLTEIYQALRKSLFPGRWEDLSVTDWKEVPNIGKVRIVAVSENINDDPGYSDLNVFVVFELRNQFYRLEGNVSSYAGREWNDFITPVQKRTREVYVYE